MMRKLPAVLSAISAVLECLVLFTTILCAQKSSLCNCQGLTLENSSGSSDNSSEAVRSLSSSRRSSAEKIQKWDARLVRSQDSVDCTWKEWGHWSICNCSSKGLQNRKRLRVVGKMAGPGGKPCDTDKSIEQEECPCPRDCTWSKWGEWSKCKNCYEKERIFRNRTRHIEKKAKYNGTCDDKDVDYQPCNVSTPCPVDCKWSIWGGWSECSRCYNTTRQSRTRTRNEQTPAKDGGKPCSGSNTENEECPDQPRCPIDCKWGNWDVWSDCSKCYNTTQQDRTRTRKHKIEAQFDGKPCPGSNTETEPCPHQKHCPINCTWGLWVSWGECSRSCGGGLRTRNRTVKVKAAHEGATCSALDDQEKEKCNIDVCPPPRNCSVFPWSAWSNCTGVCGAGVEFRSRAVKTPAEPGGMCPDLLVDQKPCDAKKQQCPTECEEAYGSRPDFQEWMGCMGGTKRKDCGFKVKHRKRLRKPSSHVSRKRLFKCRDMDFRFCNNTERICPEDTLQLNGTPSKDVLNRCYYDLWTQYAPCDQHCGPGKAERKRKLLYKHPHGTAKCNKLTQRTECEVRSCIVAPEIKPKEEESFPTWIIGIIIVAFCCLIIVAVVITVIVLVMRKRKSSQTTEKDAVVVVKPPPKSTSKSGPSVSKSGKGAAGGKKRVKVSAKGAKKPKAQSTEGKGGNGKA